MLNLEKLKNINFYSHKPFDCTHAFLDVLLNADSKGFLNISDISEKWGWEKEKTISFISDNAEYLEKSGEYIFVKNFDAWKQPNRNLDEYYHIWNNFVEVVNNQGFKLKAVKQNPARDLKINRHIRDFKLNSEKYKLALQVCFMEKNFYFTKNFFDFDWMFRYKNSRGEPVCNFIQIIEHGKVKGYIND